MGWIAALGVLLSGTHVSRSENTATPPPRPSEVKVAVIQCSSALGQVENNRRQLAALVEQAATHGAKIIVAPETAITGYLSQDLKTAWQYAAMPLSQGLEGEDPLPFAETVPGASTRFFCGLSKRLGVYVTVPFVEIDRSGPTNSPPRLFNTVCLASPKGEIVAHYRKLTPWPFAEKSWASPGDRGVQTYDTEYGRVGLAICFDIHTILEKYRPHRIWALLYPIAWVDDNHPAEWFWHKLPQRVAAANCHLIGANWSVDEPQKWFGYGFSTIISARGEVIASAKSLHGSEIVYATIPTAWAQTKPNSDQKKTSAERP